MKKLLFIIPNIFFAIHCFMSWREVWGLQGGFGRGIWAECSTYMMDAKSGRKSSTGWLLAFTALHILAYMNGEIYV